MNICAKICICVNIHMCVFLWCFCCAMSVDILVTPNSVDSVDSLVARKETEHTCFCCHVGRLSHYSHVCSVALGLLPWDERVYRGNRMGILLTFSLHPCVFCYTHLCSVASSYCWYCYVYRHTHVYIYIYTYNYIYICNIQMHLYL